MPAAMAWLERTLPLAAAAPRNLDMSDMRATESVNVPRKRSATGSLPGTEQRVLDADAAQLRQLGYASTFDRIRPPSVMQLQSPPPHAPRPKLLHRYHIVP